MNADAGARKLYSFGCGDPRSVIAVSRFTIARSADCSTGAIGASTPDGLAASFDRSTPSKWTSPANASTTGPRAGARSLSSSVRRSTAPSSRRPSSSCGRLGVHHRPPSTRRRRPRPRAHRARCAPLPARSPPAQYRPAIGSPGHHLRTLCRDAGPAPVSGRLSPAGARERRAARRDHRERRSRAPHQLRPGLRRLARVQRDQGRRRVDAPRGDRATEPHLLRRDRHPDRACC